MDPAVSIIFVTLDRFDLTRECITTAINRAGMPFDLLATDNGSSDQRVVDYLKSLNPYYLRLNPTNEGYAPALNQMLLRVRTDHFAIIDPDLLLPPNWLSALCQAYTKIPNSGIASIHCVQQLWPEQDISGIKVHPGGAVYGVKFFSKEILRDVGYYEERFTPYGAEDCQMNFRMHRTNHLMYYLSGMSVIHLGDDVHANNAYRKMKWAALEKSDVVFKETTERMDEEKNYYVPPPELR